MVTPPVQQLEGLKYTELRKLAKQAGLKVNLKADLLLKALKKHFHPAVLPEQTSDDSDGNCTLSDQDESQSCEATEEAIPTVTSLKVNEGDKVVQECQEIQENKNEKVEESARPESARRQRRRSRTKDVISEKTKKTLRQKGTPSPATKIPRHTGRLSKAGSKSSTPNCKTVHEALFNKIESIDKYVERQQKRLDAVSSSIHEVKMMALKSSLLPQAEKTPGSSKKLLQSKYFILSPAPLKVLNFAAQTPASQRRSARFSKSILANKSAIKPSTLSATKMNVRFSETTKDNEHKQSLIKTPARKSSSFATPVSAARRSLPLQKAKPVSDANKSLLMNETDLKFESSKMLSDENCADENKMNQSATTPFKFTGQPTTPSTNKKLKFDLHASLSRPLGYQPHKGKLKPWEPAKENHTGTRNNAAAIKNNCKQPILSTRDDRRKQHGEDRKLNRDKAVGTRRGVVIAISCVFL